MTISKLLIKTSLLLVIFLAGYFFFVLRPRLLLPNKIIKTEAGLNEHRSTLLQNRLALIELTRIDPDSGRFDFEKTNLVGTIQETNKRGLETLEGSSTIPEIDKELSSRYQGLLDETRRVYEEQGKLLERVFATDNYGAGVEVLHSDESIELLARQTNLVLEYDFWLEKVQLIRAEFVPLSQ